MRASWGTRGLLALAIIVCGIAFTPLVQGLGWLARPTVLVVLASLAMAITASVARRRGWPLLVGALVSLACLTGMFVSSSALLVIVPGPRTPGALVRLAMSGGQSIATQSIPALPSEGIVFLLAIGLTALVLGIELLVFVARIPALVGIPLVAVSVIPNIIDPDTVQVPIFIVLAVLYVGVLLARRPGNRPIVVVAGAAAVVGALVLAAVLPPVAANESIHAGTGANVNDPLIDVEKSLVQPNPRVAYTYKSAVPSYFTLSIVDDFSGLEWKADTFVPGGDVRDIGPDPLRAPDARVTDIDAEVSIEGITGSLLPVPWAPESVTGLEGDWSWERSTLGVRSTDSHIEQQEYDVKAAIAAPTEEQLEAAGTTVPSTVKQFTTTPDGMPAIISDRAREVTAGSTSFYQDAVRLENYFHGADFHYSTQAPVDGGYDGSGADVVAEFLTKKFGYCVHYSSAMALMARSLGIPARLAIGFTGGEPTSIVSGVTTYSVSTRDMHAWPELYFSGVGWVRFEPTPGIGSVPQFPQATSTPTAAPTRSATAPVPSSSETAPPPTDAPAPEAQQPTQSSASGMTTEQLRSMVITQLIILIVIIVLLGPLIARTIRRRLRYQAMGTGDALAGWTELKDTAIDVGIDVVATRTARGFATQLSERIPPDAEGALGRILDVVEMSAYARNRLRYVDAGDLTEVRKAILRSARLRDRALALFLPRSLLARHSAVVVE